MFRLLGLVARGASAGETGAGLAVVGVEALRLDMAFPSGSAAFAIRGGLAARSGVDERGT